MVTFDEWFFHLLVTLVIDMWRKNQTNRIIKLMKGELIIKGYKGLCNFGRKLDNQNYKLEKVREC